MVPTVSDSGPPQRWAHLSVIGSKHAVVEQYLAIQNNSRPNPQRLIVLDGLWEIESALDAGLELVAVIVAPELFRGNRAVAVLNRAESAAGRVYAISPKLANRLSDRDTSDGLAAIAMSRQWQLADLAPGGPRSLVLVLDGLEVLGNVGTAVRSAQASGA
jgi:RNA methyltransferase, TrmH family